MNSSRSWIVWSVAVLAYLIAVMQRSTLGVAGVDAANRFDLSASALSSLVVSQIVVYAALQIPVGVVLDRLGPKVLIAVGAALMLVGQLALAFAPGFEIALLGRILVGAGDAMTFISVLRLLSFWFSGRILPQVSQWTGNIGALGQILSVVPFSWLLHGIGWPVAFTSAAAAAGISFALVLVLVSNGAGDSWRADRVPNFLHALRQLRESLSRPGTQLGFWSHFVTQSPGSVFSLLWGFPVLVAGLGYSTSVATGLLALLVVAGIVSGPILGILSARFPLRRSNLVLATVGVIAAAWAAVILWPGEPPLWLLASLIFILGVGAPGSLIGFDFARTFNPMRSLGSASGIVNVGGFLATFVMMLQIGVVLDLVNQWNISRGMPDDLFSWDGFRIAFATQYLVIGAGVAALLHARGRTRRRLHEEEGIQVAPLWVVFVRNRKRRKAQD